MPKLNQVGICAVSNFITNHLGDISVVKKPFVEKLGEKGVLEAYRTRVVDTDGIRRFFVVLVEVDGGARKIARVTEGEKTFYTRYEA